MPRVKTLNLGEITTSTGVPNYDCTNTTSFNLNTYSCGSYCDYTYTVNNDYNITWQAPANWMQTSISANGSEVSFTPDATSGGTLIATITLSPCGYTETRSFAINRRIEAPSFSPTNRVSTCTSTATLAINPICGAIDYTYTISGSLGVVFTSNGLQTLTTTNSYADLSFSGSPSSNTLKAKANYPNNNSSSEVSIKINYGAVAPGPISFPLIDPEIGRIQALIDEVPGATSYNWYKNGVLVSVYHGTFAQIPISRTQCNIEYDISVEAITCGTTSLKSHANAYVPCYNYYTVSPNPATDDVTISTDESKKQSINTTFSEVRIFDFSGNLKKSRKYNKVKSATVNVSDLKNGNYTIEIIEEGFSEKKAIINTAIENSSATKKRLQLKPLFFI